MNSLMRPLLAFLLVTLAASAHAQESKLRYAPATLPNVSDALFRKGILRTDDPVAIEEYIRIHHCGLYEQYGSDDFSWARLREAQARHLDVHMSEFAEGIEVSVALPLEQYDMGTNQFMIAGTDQLENAGFLTVWREHGGSMNPCAGREFNPFVPRMHPLELTVKVDTPVTLKGIPMPQARANELVTIMNKRGGSEYERRQGTLVMRLRITGIDPLAGVTDKLRRVVLGQIDELRVYEGPERKMLLFRKEFENRPAGTNKN